MQVRFLLLVLHHFLQSSVFLLNIAKLYDLLRWMIRRILHCLKFRFYLRSDAQRSEEHKLKKEKELEREIAASEREDDGGFPMKVKIIVSLAGLGKVSNKSLTIVKHPQKTVSG